MCEETGEHGRETASAQEAHRPAQEKTEPPALNAVWRRGAGSWRVLQSGGGSLIPMTGTANQHEHLSRTLAHCHGFRWRQKTKSPKGLGLESLEPVGRRAL